jgi:hypothetical protein
MNKRLLNRILPESSEFTTFPSSTEYELQSTDRNEEVGLDGTIYLGVLPDSVLDELAEKEFEDAG